MIQNSDLQTLLEPDPSLLADAKFAAYLVLVAVTGVDLRPCL